MIRCEYKYSGNAFAISAPHGVDVLPGRMIRKIIDNLEKKYSLCEFSMVKGRRAAEQKEDVIADVFLKSGTGAFLFNSQPVVVMQKLHPSMYDPDFVQLSDEETMEFQKRLPDDEGFNYEDFTISMPADYFIAVSDNIKSLAKVLDHLRLEDFDAFRKAISKLCIASITIYDEADMFVEYNEKTFPTTFTEGIEEYLYPPEHVEELNF